MNPPPNPRLRVGDADREQAIAALQSYVASGHLTLDEFSHRSGAAYQARTHADLAALTSDLPPAAEPARAAGGAGDPASRRLWTLALVALAALAGIGTLTGFAHLAAAGSMMGGMC